MVPKLRKSISALRELRFCKHIRVIRSDIAGGEARVLGGVEVGDGGGDGVMMDRRVAKVRRGRQCLLRSPTFHLAKAWSRM